MPRHAGRAPVVGVEQVGDRKRHRPRHGPPADGSIPAGVTGALAGVGKVVVDRAAIGHAKFAVPVIGRGVAQEQIAGLARHAAFVAASVGGNGQILDDFGFLHANATVHILEMWRVLTH